MYSQCKNFFQVQSLQWNQVEHPNIHTLNRYTANEPLSPKTGRENGTILVAPTRQNQKIKLYIYMHGDVNRFIDHNNQLGDTVLQQPIFFTTNSQMQVISLRKQKN